MSPDLAQRLRKKLIAHQARQLEILKARPDPNTRVSQPGEDRVRVERANRMKERGCLLFEPLPANALVAFEEQYGVSLPPDYRDFLIEIGDGGEGPPFYGLLKLGEKADGWSNDEQFANLGKPFPFMTHWVWDTDDAWSSEKDLLKEAAVRLHGALVLGTDGCGIDWVLIVTGTERGQVWQICEQGVQPCAPKRAFLSWYEYWLDGGEDWWPELE